jgi:hypothetical protein
MPAGPPRILERIIGLLIPPSRREDVLGDLRERYAGFGRYIVESIRTVPMVIFSAIRRTTDPQLFLTEALLLYVSFLSALWYLDRAMLNGQWGLLRPAIPAAIAIAVLLFYDAWAPAEKQAPFSTALRIVIALAIACLCQIAALPPAAALFGGGIAALLVSTVRMLFLFGPGMPEKAGGPTPPSKEPSRPEISANAKRLRDAGVTALILALFALALRYGGMPLMMAAVVGAVVYQFRGHSWKG